MTPQGSFLSPLCSSDFFELSFCLLIKFFGRIREPICRQSTDVFFEKGEGWFGVEVIAFTQGPTNGFVHVFVCAPNKRLDHGQDEFGWRCLAVWGCVVDEWNDRSALFPRVFGSVPFFQCWQNHLWILFKEERIQIRERIGMFPVFDFIDPGFQNIPFFFSKSRSMVSIVKERQRHRLMNRCVFPDVVPDFMYFFKRKTIFDDLLHNRQAVTHNLEVCGFRSKRCVVWIVFCLRALEYAFNFLKMLFHSRFSIALQQEKPPGRLC